jgi:allophanate hydrolase subunit 1
MEDITQPIENQLIRFSPEEVSEVTAIRESYDSIVVSFGQLEMQKRELAKTEKRIEERIVATENQEKVFLDKIVAKYGEGTFDIATGIFTPKK